MADPQSRELTESAGLAIQSSAWAEAAGSLVVSSAAEYELACDQGREIATAIGAVRDMYKDEKARRHKAHRAICDEEAELLRPLETAKARYARATADYREAEERRRRAEQARLDAEHAARVEAERKAEAERLRAAGQPEAAALTEATPDTTPPPQAASRVPKARGTAGTEHWRWELEDLGALIVAVHAGKHPPDYLIPNAAVLDGLARDLKSAFKVAGCRVIRETSTSFRR